MVKVLEIDNGVTKSRLFIQRVLWRHKLKLGKRLKESKLFGIGAALCLIQIPIHISRVCVCVNHGAWVKSADSLSMSLCAM